MTLAVCWKCGSRKVGALTWCAACKAEPSEPEDKAASILLSDHCRSAAELDALGGAIARGEPVHFDEAELARVTAAVRAAPRLPRGCMIAAWMPFIVLGLLAGVVIALYLLGAYK